MSYTTIKLTEEELAVFYETSSLPLVREPVENEYFMIYCNDELVDKICYQHGKFRPLKFKNINSFHLGKLYPRNPEQELAFDMLQDDSTCIKILAGQYGSGKSLLIFAHALQALEREKIEKIVFVRNNVELKDTTPLGALPGSLNDKTIEWAANLGDHLGGMEGVRYMVDKNQLEIIPLGYMRGRDLKHCIIFVDEAENLTTHQCQLLIGRIGEGSQLWLAGDRRQTDKAVFDKDSGMQKMIDRLTGKPLFRYVYLSKSERSEASAYADYLDD